MIGILGSGAFGTALAVALSAVGPVRLWTRSAEAAAQMTARRENTSRLPGVALPDTLYITDSIAELGPCDILLLAVPMQTLRQVLIDHGPALAHARPVA